MKKLLLINAVGQKSGFNSSRIFVLAPLGLAYVAAATPSDWQVKIVDESCESLKYEDADLVGVSAFTCRIPRAYEIAKVYRDRGIKVVLGGNHASMLPDEATGYVDTVVVGEAEGIWGQVIDDFEHGRMAQRYDGPTVDWSKPALRPRRDLLHPAYFWEAIQTSRGCPFNCSFCCVSKYLGKEYRKRAPDDVIDELRDIKGQWVGFIDDNMIGYTEEQRETTAELFSGMIKKGLKKKWWMQTSLNAADDERIVKLAGKAGCMFAFIGFEAISEGTLKTMRKGINLKIGVKHFKHVIDTFHKYGIAVMGGFITGNDHEPPEYYEQLADFLLKSGLDISLVSLLTPLPGTDFMDDIVREDRLVYKDFPNDWAMYQMAHVVHRPQGTTPEAIYKGQNYVKSKLYHFPYYQYRLLTSFWSVKGLDRMYCVYKMNQMQRGMYRRAHYRNVGTITMP